MSTIQDIAKLAGVSAATVSRTINSSGYVSVSARQKVEEAIKELNYAPNKNAQYLRKGATKTLGIVSTQFNETVLARINPFIDEAYSAGYTTTLFITNGDSKRELEAFDLLKSKQLDGIFLIYRANDWHVLESYADYGPIVTLHNINSNRIPSVFIDHYKGLRLALEFSWETGCRRILNLYGTPKGLNTKRRMDAYHDFCMEKGVKPYPSEPFFHIGSDDSVERVVKWIASQKEKPDAITTHSDTVSALVVSKLKRHTISVPDTISVIGFDNLPISDMMNITTVDYGIEDQGRNACYVLLHHLKESSKPLTPLSFKLIKRGTTNLFD